MPETLEQRGSILRFSYIVLVAAAAAAAAFLALRTTDWRPYALARLILSTGIIDNSLTDDEKTPDDLPKNWGKAGYRHPHSKSGESKVAAAIRETLQSAAAEYNKPQVLLLGESTPVQLVIATGKDQEINSYFTGFKGEVEKTIARVADDVSAQLSGPPDRLQITRRGEKRRTIASPEPIAWIWDVVPLKPGNAEVTLEVTSYIKNGKDTEPVPIRVLQDTWFVDARGYEWVKYEISEFKPVQQFLFAAAGAAATVLAWFGISGLRRKT